MTLSMQGAKKSAQSLLAQFVTTTVIIIPAIAAFYSAADALGMPLPRIVFETRLVDAERRVHRNIWVVGDSVMERLRREIEIANAAIDGYKSRGERVPDFLLFQKTQLELELAEIERAVNDSKSAETGRPHR